MCVSDKWYMPIYRLYTRVYRTNRQFTFIHKTQENVDTIKASQTRTAHIDQTPMVGYLKSFTDYDYWCLTPF